MMASVPQRDSGPLPPCVITAKRWLSVNQAADAESASTLISAFPASRPMGGKLLLLISHAVYHILCDSLNRMRQPLPSSASHCRFCLYSAHLSIHLAVRPSMHPAVEPHTHACIRPQLCSERPPLPGLGWVLGRERAEPTVVACTGWQRSHILNKHTHKTRIHHRYAERWEEAAQDVSGWSKDSLS